MYLSAILYTHSFPSHPLLPPLLSFSRPPSSPSPPLVAHSSDYQNPMLHRSWNSCGATFPVGLMPWERRRSSIRVTRHSPWQFVMCAAAEDNHSKPGAVCPQVSWWGGGTQTPESTGPVVSRPLPCFTMHGPFSCFKIIVIFTSSFTRAGGSNLGLVRQNGIRPLPKAVCRGA